MTIIVAQTQNLFYFRLQNKTMSYGKNFENGGLGDSPNRQFH